MNKKNDDEQADAEAETTLEAPIDGSDEAVDLSDVAVEGEEATLKVSEADIIAELQKALGDSRAETAEQRDKYLRALADFENFKRRAAKERSDLQKYQGEKILADILEVVDNIELALRYGAAEHEKLKAGLDLIHRRFVEILARWEVKGESGVGKEFDPATQSAISNVPAAGAKPGTVVDELKKTYFYKDKILRIGEVVVAQEEKPQEQAEAGRIGAPEN